jgi:hypothetical protein
MLSLRVFSKVKFTLVHVPAKTANKNVRAATEGRRPVYITHTHIHFFLQTRASLDICISLACARSLIKALDQGVRNRLRTDLVPVAVACIS